MNDMHVTVIVEAESMDEAKKKAEEAFLNADFSETTDLDGKTIIVEG